MPEKTYMRTVYRLFTREELSEMLKRAHEECKREVPLSYHRIGVKRKRPIIARNREQYLACIRRKIDEEIKKRLESMNVSFAG